MGWEKLWIAARAVVSDVTEAVIDSQALRIVEQEVRDAVRDEKRDRQQLDDFRYYLDLAIQQQSSLQARRGEGSKQASRDQEEIVVSLQAAVAEMEEAIVLRQRTIQSLKAQVSLARANQAVIDAQRARAQAGQGGAGSAMDSLRRIRARQEQAHTRAQAAKTDREPLDDDESGAPP